MGIRNNINVVLIAIMLSACASHSRPITDIDNNPINLIPMYGYPAIEKTEQQQKADEQFIKTVTGSIGSREKASKEFAGRGWYFLKEGNSATSMRRFNQSWLLDPDYYMSHWGFGVLLFKQDKPAEAIPNYYKALSLIDDNHSDKPRLLADTAKAYVVQGHAYLTTDKVKSAEYFEEASSLANETLKLDPQFGSEALKTDQQFREAYRYGALIYYDQGNYNKAWEIVKRSRASGGYDFDPEFIKQLSGKMQEPK
jgi:tetratricopeptide (TPR) repeat protein